MSNVNSMHFSEEFFKQIMLYIEKKTLLWAALAPLLEGQDYKAPN
jgi:hypothetical protein